MMSINTSRFLMPETVVTETIAVIHYAVIIMLKNIKGIGRIVPNAEILLKLKCMFITEQMNIILRSWKILRLINRQNALSVAW